MERAVHHTIRTLCTAALLTLAASCNPDIFVEDFMPVTPEFNLDGNGDSVKIGFASDNWHVKYLYGPGSVDGLYFTVRDADGNDNGDQCHFEAYNRFSAVRENDLLALSFSKLGPMELTVKIKENLFDNPYLLHIVAGNEYEDRDIKVTISPSEKYVVDNIVFSNDIYDFYNVRLEPVDEILVDNTQSAHGETVIYRKPYENAHRTIRFVFDQENICNTVKPDIEIEVPNVYEGKEKLEFRGEKTGISEREIHLPLTFPTDSTFAYTVKPGIKRVVATYLEYAEFKTDFTMYLSNPVSGRKKVFTGRLESEVPFASFIFGYEPTNKEQSTAKSL